MRTIITFFLVFAFQFLNAQYTVKGVFTDTVSNIRDVALYKIEKGTANYVKYANVKDKQFIFSMDSLSSGCYRALYKNVKTGYVDFIYNKEDVNFTVDSEKGQPSVFYSISKENQLLQAYNYNINQLQYRLDSIQLQYFGKPTVKVEKYQDLKLKIDGAQKYYEDLAKNDFCLAIIKASKRYNAPLPFTTPEEYLQSIVTHFFDYIDFKEERLRNSMFIKSRINDYIFYLHQTDDVVQQNKMYIEAINDVLKKTDDVVFKEEVLHFLIPEFINKENKKVLSAAVSLYKQLPTTIQDKQLLIDTDKRARTLLGAIAPNIKISDTESLYSLGDADKYLIIFWSSTCSHCALELPKVEELLSLKEGTGITVIAVGLEKKEDKQGWQNAIKEYPQEWKNVIAIGKWESKEAIEYNINSTPTYFLLNKEKQIVAKPNSFNVLENILK